MPDGNSLGALKIQRKTGAEPFTFGGMTEESNLLCFWQWAYSDLVSNSSRGVLAEFLVAHALGIGMENSGDREEWAQIDLTTPSGVLIEVKSAAYVQSWNQHRLSRIVFGVRKTRGWNSQTGETDNMPARHADVYVFTLLKTVDKSQVNPLDIDQWEFYVLPTKQLNTRQQSQHSITLESLRDLTSALHFRELRGAVEQAAGRSLQ